MQVLNRKEVAAILKVKPKTIRLYEKRGAITPAYYVSGHPRYTVESIESAVTENNKSFVAN